MGSINPTHGAAGDTVTISGSGFQSTPSMNTVSINGKQALTIGASPTQLQVIVPSLCGTGNVIVSANGTFGMGPLFTYDVASRLTTFATGLHNPEYLTADGSGNLYVTNFGSGTVSKISPAGMATTVASGLNQPTGVTIDANGNLYVASNGGRNVCTIMEITPAGAVRSFATISGYVYGLATDNAGNIYAANFTNASILKITNTGNTSTFATTLNAISDLAFDGNGNLYATGILGGTVFEIFPGGYVNTIFSGFNLEGPNGIAIDSHNNLFISVSGNNTLSEYNTITELSSTGALTTFATGLDQPCGLIIDANGSLCVVNTLAGSISKIKFQ
ncbi:MAG TPA: IPT/TIG domain-containing protein [Puia sp.]|nr:IPT/TIG domain-containing protein [Puia sp.]